MELPELPKSEVQHVTWGNDGCGWSQYHDQRDPLPDKWDDDEPDVVRGFYSGDQMREYARQAVAAERAARAIRLADFINAAGINGSDMPHTVVEKVQAAIDAAIRKEPV